MDTAKLSATVKLAEGLRLKAYEDTTGHLTIGLDMRPSLSIDDRQDAGSGDAELFSKHSSSNYVSPISFTNVKNIEIRQFSHLPSVHALCSLLQACRICVNHLFAHRSYLKIGRMVIRSIAVKMVDCQTFRNWADKRLVDKSMNQVALVRFSSVAESHPSGGIPSRFCIRTDCHRSRALTPGTDNPAHVSLFSNFVESLISLNWFPHPRLQWIQQN